MASYILKKLLKNKLYYFFRLISNAFYIVFKGMFGYIYSYSYDVP